MRIEKSCPIPQTHNRLRRFHDLWHELAAAYPDGEAFLDKLNDCFQASRNVTFVLQSEASRRDWFKEWYEEQRVQMKADPLLKWAHGARTTVVHQGDLEAHSVAKVSLVVTDATFELAEVEVPPFVSPEVAAAAIKLDNVPDRIREQAVMSVERRWTVPELPDGELLDALGHCYGVIAEVVREAHERCGVEMQTFGGETHGKRHHREPHPSGRLPCMLPTREMRTAYWHMGAESAIEQEMETLPPPTAEEQEEIAREARRRYGDLSQHRLMPGMPMMERGEAMHHVARVVLTADGYHQHFSWTFRGGTPVDQFEVTPEDQQDKLLKVRRIATEVERAGADSVVIVGEMWLARDVPRADPRARLRAGERDDREEALVTALLQRSGESRRWTSVFRREEDGAIVLDEPQEDELGFMPLYEPIFNVWQAWDARESAASTP